MSSPLRIAVLALLALLPLSSKAEPDIPYLTGRVVDNADILSDNAERRVSEAARAHEEHTGNQIAVLTLGSLDGLEIEDFATQVFESWKLGQKGKDNGVLFIVAPNDRRMRMEVGYGLEATLTDADAGRIIREVVTPPFKSGDYDGGVEQGVGAVIRVLEGGQLPEAAAGDGESGESESGALQVADLSTSERILIGAFIFGIIGLFTVIGILTPGVGWFLYFFLIPFWAMFPIAIIGTDATLKVLGTYVVGYPILKLLLSRTEWYRKNGEKMKTKGGGGGVGGFSWGSSSSGGWSSGGSGGFSGGGGRSGGGGASGSW